MTGDGTTATGGMRGITDDTPEHTGAVGEAGSIDGVSGAGGTPELTQHDNAPAPTVPEVRAPEAGDGLIQPEGVTGSPDP